MRTAAVLTNRRCNQACGHCFARAAHDDLAAIQPARLLAAVDEAIAAGATEIVFSGGEPLLRSDLEVLVRQARSRGATAVIVETNGTLVDDARARALREAGVSLARVNLAGSSDALDAVTCDPGGHARTLAGLRALAAAGIPIEIRTALVQETLPLVRSLPSALATAGLAYPALRELRIVVPVEAPSAEALVSYEEAVPVILELEASGRRAGLPVLLAPEPGPPPCVFPHAGRAAHLFSLTPGALGRRDAVRVEACGSCAVADRCPGFPAQYVGRRGVPPHAPIVDDRVRRRLSLVSSVEAQVDREVVQVNVTREAETGGVLEEHLVRVVFHCNQACHFCFVSTHLPGVADERLFAAIDSAVAREARVVLTGGEPTLHPRLAQLVARARAGRHLVEIQTNAVRFAEGGLAASLADAGLGLAFVSLHGATAAVSDAVTDAPGTFSRTLAGIDALRAAGVAVTLNFVVCAINAHELPAAVELCAARFPGSALNISFVAPSSDLVPRTRELIPRYRDVLPSVSRALALTTTLGVPVRGFASMCGLPLCLVPEEVRDEAMIRDVDAAEGGGEFVKTDECARCALSPKCFGLRRGYAELWGTSELAAVKPGPGTSCGAKGGN